MWIEQNILVKRTLAHILTEFQQLKVFFPCRKQKKKKILNNIGDFS